jgi:hypothetical protein
VRELLHRHSKFFLICSLAAVGLRLLFVLRFSLIAGDSLVYGDIAKNWLLHGIYGLSVGDAVRPTYMRLPGYPSFLALVFKVFGMEHYGAATFLQILVDLGTCFVVSALALEITRAYRFDEAGSAPSERPALLAFLFTALCPFLATYVAAPLTETWSIFLTALTLYFAVKGLGALFRNSASYWKWWLGCGVALGMNLYFRPDAGILLAVTGAVLFPLLSKCPKRAIASGMITLITVAALLAPWTLRNWRVMHRFQPLAPRYANDPGEFVSIGFNRWLKTWVIDFISTQNVEWRVSGERIFIDDVPGRAFDSQEEYAETEELIDSYNDNMDLSPELDERFNQLALERIRRHPLRYYVWLPALRIADMWLRPRIEILPLDLDWWRVSQNGMDSWIAIGLGALNLLLLLAALVSVWHIWPRHWSVNEPVLVFALLMGFVLLRSLFLGTLENPEPRYVLECYPVVLALAGVAFAPTRQV